MAVRITQLEIEALIAPTSAARVSQVSVETLVAINLVRGDTGITTGEAFGSGGSITAGAGDLTVTGSAGVVSAEAFGSGGALNAPYIAGSTGIDESAMGSAGSLVAGLVAGVAGISESAMGADGFVSGPITGVAGISESAMGAGGSISGPLTGAAGIATAEAFGAGGVVAGPILGSMGIVSAEVFGSGGDIRQPITGITGLASAEAFGAGSVVSGITGYLGIASTEAFGRGAVLGARPFTLFIRHLDWSELKLVNTMRVQEDYGGRASANFTISQTGTGFRPVPGDEVAYWCGSKKLFGGFIQTTVEEWQDPTDTFWVHCTCTDYRQLADNRVFSRTYNGPSHTLSVIVADLMAATLTAEGVTYENREDYTITGGRLVFEDWTVSACLDRICGVFGCDWRIDHYRRLRIERRLSDIAPTVISDDDGVVEKIRVTRTDAQYRNRQGARTSVPTAGQRSALLLGNDSWTYTLPWQLTAKPIVKVNTVAQSVVLYSQRHLAPWDFAYELNSATLYHNPVQAALTDTDEISITGLSGTIDVYWSENVDEIARRAAQTGGSGIVEAVSNARNVRDQAGAARFNEGMMNRLAATSVEVEVELTTLAAQLSGGRRMEHVARRVGWGIGQMVSIYRERPLVGGDFIITSCSFAEVDQAFLRYNFKAVARELPTIQNIEATPGPGPGEWTIDVTMDRPLDWTPGTDVNFWGIGNSGSGLGNGTYTLEPGTGGPLLRFRDPADWSGWTYPGGLNGGQYVLPNGGTYLTGGTGNTGNNPLPGPTNGGGGLPLPGGGLPTTPQGALIVENVNISTREITVDRDHSFTTSYPAFDSGTRVVVMGVRGVEDATHSINTPFSRITVTGARTFLLDDVGPFTSASPFENDRRGRVYTTDQAPRATAGLPANPNMILVQLSAAGTESNTEGGVATFLLANSIPGVASRPLQVAAAATNAWEQQKDIQVVESVSVELGTPSTGGPVRIDIKKNGASIFADGYVEIPAGETQVRTSNLAQTPMTVERGDKLQPDVVAVGSEFPGCNATVRVALRG